MVVKAWLSQMRILTIQCFFSVGLLLPLAHATEAEKVDSRRATIDQKLRLSGSMLASPKMKQAFQSDNAELRAQAEKARSLLEQAREAMVGNNLEQASATLDQVLKSISAVSSLARSGAALDMVAYRERHHEQLEQVKLFRGALLESGKDGKSAKQVGAAVAKIDALTADANGLAAANNYPEASKRLREAYLHATQELTTLRAGERVTLALKFETPADEYAYEEKVNLSHVMLLDMLMADGKTSEARRSMVNKALDENRIQNADAEREAKGGNHAAAMKILEQSTLRLKRVLQSAGVPIF